MQPHGQSAFRGLLPGVLVVAILGACGLVAVKDVVLGPPHSPKDGLLKVIKQYTVSRSQLRVRRDRAELCRSCGV